MAASALPETLKSVTEIKIVELKRQREICQNTINKIYDEANQSRDIFDTTQALLDGTCHLEGVHIQSDESDEDQEFSAGSNIASRLKNYRRLLTQARSDPAIPREVISTVRDDLKKELDLKRVQHEHAQFFSELVTEWLSDSANDKSTGIGSTSTEGSSFENVGRKEMHEQRQQWEDLVFTKAEVDETAISSYLKELFHRSKAVKTAYEDLFKSTNNFSTTLRLEKELFDPESLKTTIAGLIKTDLMSDEKKSILRTFSSNKEVLREVADVLNMRFESLEEWNWSTVEGAIPIEQRRQLNGKYRVFMDEDVLDGLLLHAIGMKWAVHFKSVLTTFFNSFAWQRGNTSIPKSDRERREYFLGKDEELRGQTIRLIRSTMYSQHYFMTQLPEHESEGVRAYDSDDEPTESSKKSPLEIKHSLLHLLITEALIAKHLHPSAPHTVIRSDFKWFGPSLPHNTVFMVLKFFGVNDFWLKFFKKFLEAPLRFVQDGPHGQIQSRKRGVPMSHALSDVFGEVILFIMDFAVNNVTQTYLYRLHDDFWFWGSENICKRGWHAMSKFSSIMGLEFNEEKTGSVVLGEQSDSSDSEDDDVYSLPKGEIRWAFLRLNSDGKFEIDQAMVDEHIKELKLQLTYCGSIFSYIQVTNSYFARFFSNNFGKPSFAFGREHIDNMIQTFSRIQNSLYSNGTVTDYLKGLAQERFEIQDLPDGFWYWPVALGGLELRNPLVPLFGMRESLRKTPDKILSKALDNDEAAYLSAKTRFERLDTGSGLMHGKVNYELKRKIEADGGQFMSKTEFLKYREERSLHLASAYEKLLSIPQEKAVVCTNEITSWLSKLDHTRRSRTGIHNLFQSMEPYWKWILAVYGPEIMEKYGNIQIVDPGQVPLGVVSVMRAGKVRWRG